MRCAIVNVSAIERKFPIGSAHVVLVDKAMAQTKKKKETQSVRSGPSRATMQWILFAFVIGLVLGVMIGYNVGSHASAGDRGGAPDGFGRSPGHAHYRHNHP